MERPHHHVPHTDQATRLRSLVRRRRHVASTIAVLSGKGGVGKSNIAVNLSICLSERGLRVALLDLDLGLANADVLMNLQPRYTLAHVIGGARSIEEVCVRGPGGICFMPGASGVHSLSNLSDFERHHLIGQLRKLALSADIAVFDLGAGLSRGVLSFAHVADCAWVVTTPEPTAVTDAYAAIKALRKERYHGSVSLLVNMADSRSQAEATYRRVAAVAQKFLDFSVANAGYLLHDSSVELAVQARCPVVIRYPGSNASACIAAMASEVARSCAPRQRPGGLLHRVAGLFV
jgi:flagellar biosynthesis protein FlhG